MCEETYRHDCLALAARSTCCSAGGSMVAAGAGALFVAGAEAGEGEVSTGYPGRRKFVWCSGECDSYSCNDVFLMLDRRTVSGSRSRRGAITRALVLVRRVEAASARENGIVGRGGTHWRRREEGRKKRTARAREVEQGVKKGGRGWGEGGLNMRRESNVGECVQRRRAEPPAWRLQRQEIMRAPSN